MPAVCCLQGLALGSLLTPLVATAGADARVRLWCGRLLQELSGHGDRVARLAWSPCGSLLATASLDGSARLWRLDAAAVEAPGALEALACGRQQLPLLVPGPVLQLPQGSRATCLAFSPDSRLLAAGSSEGAVWLLETAGDGSQPRRLSGHGGSVTSVCFSPCGQLLASASGQRVGVRGAPAGALFCTLASLLSGACCSASAGDGLCKLWGAPSGHAVAEIAAQSGPVTHCCFVALPASGVAAVSELARPPALLLTCHANPQRQGGRMLLWDAVQRRHGWVDGKLCGPVAAIDGFGGKVTSLHAWCCSKQEGSAEDGDAPQALLATACADGAVRLFDAAAVAAAQPALTAAAGSKAAAAATAPLWQVEPWSAAGGGWGDDVPAWRAVALQQAQHERSLVALSPDGRQLAVAGPDQGRIRILQADSGEQRLALVGHTAPLRALRWLGGTKLLSAGEDGSARVWCVGAA